MRAFLFGMMFALAALAVAAAWLWHRAPEYLPIGLRRDNPHSPDFAPAVYRWKDAQGRTQLSDAPPPDRPYEIIRVDPDTNVVSNVLPTERDVRRERGDR